MRDFEEQDYWIHPNNDTDPALKDDDTKCWGDLLAYGLEESPAALRRSAYKYTSCGACVSFQLWGGSNSAKWNHCGDDLDGVTWEDVTAILVGSIVEGVDFGTENHEIEIIGRTVNQVIEDYTTALEDVEQEAEYIWSQTHGCDDCHMTNEWGDEGAINPDCPSCSGEGTII
jgi:hypothetical protein